ncbi:hypothetical protein ALC57_04753 [Trachymyrmex cornetzi]|uniref:Uncharacterized protein n=1 Tax=Trachymyrmex cornetzi TaxID=471704 RepID=A0A195ECM2_9HYME|nr:hypothetical protein ALC57_04753 [Trachymyrmex cornetzi]
MGSRRDIKVEKDTYERKGVKRRNCARRKRRKKIREKRDERATKRTREEKTTVETNRRGRNEETWHTEEGTREGENERAREITGTRRMRRVADEERERARARKGRERERTDGATKSNGERGRLSESARENSFRSSLELRELKTIQVCASRATSIRRNEEKSPVKVHGSSQTFHFDFPRAPLSFIKIDALKAVRDWGSRSSYATDHASQLKKENGKAAYASRVSCPTVRGARPENRVDRARKYLSANRMDTSRNRIRRMVGLLWFCFFFAGVLAEGTLEKLHEESIIRASDVVHVLCYSFPRDTTQRVIGIMKKLGAREVVSGGKERGERFQANFTALGRPSVTTGPVRNAGQPNWLVGRSGAEEYGTDMEKRAIISRERHTVITGNADGGYADGRHRQSAI